MKKAVLAKENRRPSTADEDQIDCKQSLFARMAVEEQHRHLCQPQKEHIVFASEIAFAAQDPIRISGAKEISLEGKECRRVVVWDEKYSAKILKTSRQRRFSNEKP